MLMASCSNDEVVETARGRSIGFSPFINNATRADLTNQNILDFAVWAVTYAGEEAPASIFLGDKVYRSTPTDPFQYADERYWLNDKNYRFSAIAPYQAVSSGLEVEQSLVPISGVPQGGLKLTFDNKLANADIDLCYAFYTVAVDDALSPPSNKNNIPAGGMVPFDFSHMLSRVKFTFNNQFPGENTVIRIVDVSINNAPSKATLDKTAGEELWTLAPGNAPFAVGFPVPTGVSSLVPGIHDGIVSKSTTGNKYLLPLTTDCDLTMSFTVRLYAYDDKQPEGNKYKLQATYTHTNCALPIKKFENGKSYNFVADITKDNIDPEGQLFPIKFTVNEVEDWGDTWTDSTVDHDHSVPSPIKARR